MCNGTFQEPLLDRLSRADCDIYRQEMLEQCAVDQFNQHCFRRAPELNSPFGFVVSTCNAFGSGCDSRCTNALRNFADLGGCCINNLYNGSLAGITSFRYSWFSSQYWSICGLRSPGFCSGNGTATTATTVGSGAVNLQASIVILVIIVSFVF